jgi:HEAT repeat protein
MTTTIDLLGASDDKLRFILLQTLQSHSEEHLFELVLEEDIVLRTAAARELHTRATSKTFEFAVQLVHSPRFGEREIAAFILGQLGSPVRIFHQESLKLLLGLIDDPYYEVRATAAGAIGFIAVGIDEQIPDVVDSLVRLKTDKHDSVRASLAYALAFLRFDKSNDCLISMIDDNSAEVQEAVDFALEMHKAN